MSPFMTPERFHIGDRVRVRMTGQLGIVTHVFANEHVYARVRLERFPEPPFERAGLYHASELERRPQ